MSNSFKYCPQCAAPLAWRSQVEDGGEKSRLRCPACDYTHWNNPTPVLAGVVEVDGRILLARNAATTIECDARQFERRVIAKRTQKESSHGFRQSHFSLRRIVLRCFE